MSADSSLRVQIALVSVHHGNTEKVAGAIAEVLQATVIAPEDLRAAHAETCDLLGFGSGIYGGEHHHRLLDLVHRLPALPGKGVFLFSTFGAPALAASHAFVERNHYALRERLRAKGASIAGEFGCPGFNTNSFLRFLGGLNRGRPNAADLDRARAFARTLSHSE